MQSEKCIRLYNGNHPHGPVQVRYLLNQICVRMRAYVIWKMAIKSVNGTLCCEFLHLCSYWLLKWNRNINRLDYRVQDTCTCLPTKKKINKSNRWKKVRNWDWVRRQCFFFLLLLFCLFYNSALAGTLKYVSIGLSICLHIAVYECVVCINFVFIFVLHAIVRDGRIMK